MHNLQTILPLEPHCLTRQMINWWPATHRPIDGFKEGLVLRQFWKVLCLGDIGGQPWDKARLFTAVFGWVVLKMRLYSHQKVTFTGVQKQKWGPTFRSHHRLNADISLNKWTCRNECLTHSRDFYKSSEPIKGWDRLPITTHHHFSWPVTKPQPKCTVCKSLTSMWRIFSVF